MNADAKKSIALTGLSVAFFALAGAFLLDLWGRPASLAPIPPTPPEFTNTATVRLSAGDLFRTEGDTSGLVCYTCHDAKKQLDVNLDTNGNGKVDPLDVLEVVNYINASKAGGGGAEGEPRIDAIKADYAFASSDLESLVGFRKSKLAKSDIMLAVDDYYQNLDQKRSRRR